MGNPVQDFSSNPSLEESISRGNPSEIRRFYSGTKILLTGSTGFLGKLLLEKLLRGCPQIQRIFLLIRGDHPSEKMQRMLKSPVFDRLRQEQPLFDQKLTPLRGDVELFELGLASHIRKMIMEEVDIIINNASTGGDEDVEFSTAIKTNVGSVKHLIALAKEMLHLKSLVHVSTIFAHTIKNNTIEEVFYNPPMVPSHVLSLASNTSSDTMEAASLAFMGEWDDKLLFTKAVAEAVIKEEGSNLPITIVRPSLVLATYKEPFPNWIEDKSLYTKLFMGWYNAFWHVYKVNDDANCELVPADHVVNAIIAAGWAGSTSSPLSGTMRQSQEDVPIINVTSPSIVSWGKALGMTTNFLDNMPLPTNIYFPFRFATKYQLFYIIYLMFVQYVLALVLDIISIVSWKKPTCIENTLKYQKMMKKMSSITLKDIKVTNRNLEALWSAMNDDDRESFNFNSSDGTVMKYIGCFVTGCRKYIAKFNMKDLPQQIALHRNKFFFHCMVCAFFIYWYAKLVMVSWKKFFG